jgi:hypothetical protein
MRFGGREQATAISAAVLLLAAAPASAQLSSSLSVDSDYRYRGLSLSDVRPAVRLNLAYDPSGGAYGGLSLIGTRDGTYGDIGLSSVVYAGYVWQTRNGPAWEAGISHTHIRDGVNYDYDEVYGGVITQAFTARAYYSPHYYGGRTRTLYDEVNTGKRLSANWRAFLHAGMLTPLNGVYRRERYDLRAGLAVSLSHYEIQAAWSKSNPAYFARRPDDGDALVLSASCFF